MIIGLINSIHKINNDKKKLKLKEQELLLKEKNRVETNKNPTLSNKTAHSDSLVHADLKMSLIQVKNENEKLTKILDEIFTENENLKSQNFKLKLEILKLETFIKNKGFKI